MADRILIIAWGSPVRGSEVKGLEVFNEALGLLGRMQQDGRIESFDVALCAPNSEMDGLITVRGSAEQIVGLREDEEFQRNTIDAQLIVENLRHIEGYTNEAVATQIQLYTDALSKVPQRAWGLEVPAPRGGTGRRACGIDPSTCDRGPEISGTRL
jgi:hypothetical protein